MTRSTKRRRQPILETLEGRALMAAPAYGYALDLASPNATEGDGVAVDAAGDAVTTGAFDGTINLDPNNPTNPAGTLVLQAGYTDSSGTYHQTPAAYVARYDPNGNLLWAHGLGGGGASGASAYPGKIAVDGANNIYIIGYFGGTIDFGTGPGGADVTLTGPSPDSGHTAEFLAKYSQDGTVQWAVTLSPDTGDYGKERLAVDPTGGIYVSDYLNNVTTVGNQTLDPANGGYYLARSNRADGSFDWVEQFNVAVIGGVTADASGNVYLTGGFNGTVDFDPGSRTYNLFSGGSKRTPNEAAFVEKLTPSGSLGWAVAFQASGKTGRFQPSPNATGGAIALDAAGDVYTAGSYGGTVDFDPSGSVYNLPTSGRLYVSKLTSNGQFVWADQIGSGAYRTGLAGLVIDTSGNVDVTGDFVGTANFNPSGTYNLTSNGYTTGSDYAPDIFVEQLSADGGFNWAISAGSTGWDQAYGIAVDGSGNIFLTGIFSDTVNFDPNGTQNRTATSSNGNAFLWKLTP